MSATTCQGTLLIRMDSKNANHNDANDPIDHQALRALVAEACQHPKGSPQRQRGLTQLIRIMTRRLWHTAEPYYADALQQTWIYFCRNLCEANTARAYDPTVASPITWLNAYLKRRLQDFQIAENKSRATTVSQYSFSDGDGLDPVDRLYAPPDVPPWLEQVQAWAESNAELASVHVGKHPDITAQALILKRLPPETPWKTLSAEYGVSIGTLSSFYQRQCLSKLRDYGQSQGYF